MPAPVLQVKNLQVSFSSADGRSRHAVEDLSFDMAEGKVTAIVGESGSGKSMTALSINKLIPNAASMSGCILLTKEDGTVTDLLHTSEKNMQRIRGKAISMIFQEPMTSLNPVMSCGEQVAEMIRYHLSLHASEAREKTLDLFRKVQLPEPQNIYQKYPHQLSGGQRQRVMIAMAISCGPRLLIADEPTTALDVTVQKTILELIRSLQRESGMSVLFITHDMGIVSELADDVLVMHQGKLMEKGTVEQVLTQPAHPYTRALLACRPAGHPQGSRLPVVHELMQEEYAWPHASVNYNSAAPAEKTASQKTDGTRLVSVRHLCISYHDRQQRKPMKAVDDISFDIQEGETLGLVGESGCGKTTLGRALLGLIKPSSGSILFGNQDLSKLTQKEIRKLRKNFQIVFQDPFGSLNPRHTVDYILNEPLIVHNRFQKASQRKEFVANMLQKVGLEGSHANRYPHEFSGGQRQRISIARALMLEPKFLVFDESVSALDVSIQAQVLNLLADLKKEFQYTALFISHDLSVVHHVSDRIMVMQHGHLVEIGSADKVMHDPLDPYTRALIAAIPGKGRIVSGSKINLA